MSLFNRWSRPTKNTDLLVKGKPVFYGRSVGTGCSPFDISAPRIMARYPKTDSLYYIATRAQKPIYWRAGVALDNALRSLIGPFKSYIPGNGAHLHPGPSGFLREKRKGNEYPIFGLARALRSV